MVSRSGAVSREAREVVLTLLSPLPFLILSLYLMGLFSGGVVFFLTGGITISFFYIFVKKATNQISGGLEETLETHLAPEYNDKSITESLRQASEDFRRMQKHTNYDHITAFEKSSVLPKLVWAAKSLFWTVFVWAVLVVLLSALINVGIYETLILELRSTFTESETTSLLTLLPSVATLIAELGSNLLENIGLGNAVLVVFVTLIPSFVFQVAAVNFVAISEEFHRRFLYLWYQDEGWLRKYEAPGYLMLLAIYVAFSHLITL